MKKKILLIVFAALLISGCEKNMLGPEPENNSKSNFEVLWKTLDENYALFTVKSVNWDSLHIMYGSKINGATTDAELWNIMTGLLSNLNDGHTKLFNENYTKGFSSSKISNRSADDFSIDLIKNSLLSDPKVAGSGLITYGRIKNKNLGYIHIASFALNGFELQWAYDIDIAVKELADCDAMIIDLRNNGGGLRNTTDIIASSFIDREITYFYQQTKTGPKHDDLSGQIPISILQRKSASVFTKKNVLLTNRFSASGSEYFVQIFKNLSYSTQIGDTTFGAYGDIINIAQLPNGWTFTYPCRLTKTPEGKCFEGKGIVPDYLVENSDQDIKVGNDRVINYAIGYLSK